MSISTEPSGLPHKNGPRLDRRGSFLFLVRSPRALGHGRGKGSLERRQAVDFVDEIIILKGLV